jgi:cystathionine gamma-synthase
MSDFIKVISRQPPGGRCALYADYVREISLHLRVPVTVVYYVDTPEAGPSPPAVLLDGAELLPSDGVIISPDDLLRGLAEAGVDTTKVPDLLRALEAVQDRMLAGV